MRISFNDWSFTNKIPSSHSSQGTELQIPVQSSDRLQFCSHANNVLSSLSVQDKVGTSLP